MTRALVTGGAGFVGRHLIRRLLNDGIDVVCVDNLDPCGSGLPPADWPLLNPNRFPGFTFKHEDCRSFFARCKDPFDLVFHLAAIIGGRAVIEGRPFAATENFSIDAAFWRWAASIHCGSIIYMSSSAVYPIHLQTEQNHKLLHEGIIDFSQPVGPPDLTYGWSKLTGEYLMRLYIEQFGRRAIAFRPFSGYGEDQAADYPVTSICRRLIQDRGEKIVSVWGSGRQERDFIHIDDCIDFVMSSISRPPPNGIMNLSSGVPTSFIDLARKIAATLDYYPVVQGTPGRPEGVFSRCGDRTLQAAHNLQPSISLDEGLQRCVDFQMSQRSSSNL